MAATALSRRVYLVSITFGMGLLAGIVPMAAQAFGADRLSIIRRSLRMGLWSAVLNRRVISERIDRQCQRHAQPCRQAPLGRRYHL